jgi:dUTP pyrophosphatase
MDLTAVSKSEDEYGNIVYGTGLAFEIPKGCVGLLFPRSSNAKKDLALSNAVGVLDSTYRGEVTFKFKRQLKIVEKEISIDAYSRIVERDFKEYASYECGDRIGQIIIFPYPTIEFEEKDELSDTDRGNGGWGSTGK